jgi:hypothetical protein
MVPANVPTANPAEFTDTLIVAGVGPDVCETESQLPIEEGSAVKVKPAVPLEIWNACAGGFEPVGTVKDKVKGDADTAWGVVEAAEPVTLMTHEPALVLYVSSSTPI